MKHHAVDAAHFLHHTHLLPGLEAAVRGHAHDFAALKALPGRKFILTNAPRAYAERVLGVLGIGRCFEALISIEDMHVFGELRPKPDARMLRTLLARLRVPAVALRAGRGHAAASEGSAPRRHEDGVDAALDARCGQAGRAPCHAAALRGPEGAAAAHAAAPAVLSRQNAASPHRSRRHE